MIVSKHEMPRIITRTRTAAKFSWSFVFLFVFISVFPHIAGAQSLNISAPRLSYEAGSTFLVTVSLNTQGRSINTVSGTIDIPTDKVQFVDLRYGNSIISLWVEKPVYHGSDGTITFAGGVPGGYSGSNGPILSFTVRGKNAGSAVISVVDAKLLLNDGQGTEAAAAKGAVTVSITPATEQPKTETAPDSGSQPATGEEKDETAPEPFTPVIARDASIAEGGWFVSFNAVDKDTGISHYEVEERPWLISGFTEFLNAKWMRAEPPFVLRRQWWPGEVAVRAFDQAGNAREASVRTPFQSSFALFIFAIALALGSFTMYWTKKQSRSRRRLV